MEYLFIRTKLHFANEFLTKQKQTKNRTFITV